MSVGTAARVVTMANQIARHFTSQQHDAASAAVADHIAKFWDPRMKALIVAYSADGGANLTPVAADAIHLLRSHGAPPPQTRATTFGPAERSDAG